MSIVVRNVKAIIVAFFVSVLVGTTAQAESSSPTPGLIGLFKIEVRYRNIYKQWLQASSGNVKVTYMTIGGSRFEGTMPIQKRSDGYLAYFMIDPYTVDWDASDGIGGYIQFEAKRGVESGVVLFSELAEARAALGKITPIKVEK